MCSVGIHRIHAGEGTNGKAIKIGNAQEARIRGMQRNHPKAFHRVIDKLDAEAKKEQKMERLPKLGQRICGNDGLKGKGLKR